MQVQDKYISWWPGYVANSGKKDDIKSNIPIIGSIYSAHPIPNRSFHDDWKAEDEMLPDHTIILDGLDEDKMISWWVKTSIWANPNLQGPPSYSWSTFGWNCAKIVAKVLGEGGGDEYSGKSKSWKHVLTPECVRTYAEAIRIGLQRANRIR